MKGNSIVLLQTVFQFVPKRAKNAAALDCYFLRSKEMRKLLEIFEWHVISAASNARQCKRPENERGRTLSCAPGAGTPGSPTGQRHNAGPLVPDRFVAGFCGAWSANG